MRLLIPTLVAAALLTGGALNLAARGGAAPVREVLTGYSQATRSAHHPCAEKKAPRAALTADVSTGSTSLMPYGHM